MSHEHASEDLIVYLSSYGGRVVPLQHMYAHQHVLGCTVCSRIYHDALELDLGTEERFKRRIVRFTEEHETPLAIGALVLIALSSAVLLLLPEEGQRSCT